MKQLLSFVLTLSLLLTMTTPVHAAMGNNFDQRAADIEKTYGIKVTYNDAGERQAMNQLEQIESALTCLGSIFTQKMARYYSDETFDGELRILITADENWESFNVAGTFSSLNNTIELYVRDNSVTPAANIIHEFGHVYHWSLSDHEYGEFCDINGGKEEYAANIDNPFVDRDFLDTNRYVSKFAATRAAEDFAETFMTMIVHAGDNPANVEKDTILYRKFLWIQSSLVDHIGTQSYAAMRASDFLGIPLAD